MRAQSAQRLAFVAVCAFTGLIAGCQTTKRPPENVVAVESMRTVSAKAEEGKLAVNRVNAALDKLSAGGDMQAAFAEYTSSVEDLEKLGEDAAARSEDMQTRRKLYLERWQKETDELESPEIQQAMTVRRHYIIKEFETVKRHADEVRDAFKPYLQENENIQKALMVDLTAAGVDGLQNVFKDCKADGMVLNDKLDAYNAALKTLISRMSPSTAPASRRSP